MPGVTDLTKAVLSSERTSPKTVLGFFAGMTGIGAAAAIGGIWVLSRTPSLRYLVPIVLIVFAVFFIGLIGTVVVMANRDPSKLMLGQITGSEFAIIQRITQGDSTSGESVVADIMIEAEDVTKSQSSTPLPRSLAEIEETK